MSVEANRSDVLTDAVVVRVETNETGWALSSEAWSALAELQWLHLQTDPRGLRGVLRRDVSSDSVVATIGSLTRDLADLGLVEIRDDVVLYRAPSSITTVAALRRGLADAAIEAHGILVSDGRPSAIIDAWRAEAALAMALNQA